MYKVRIFLFLILIIGTPVATATAADVEYKIVYDQKQQTAYLKIENNLSGINALEFSIQYNPGSFDEPKNARSVIEGEYEVSINRKKDMPHISFFTISGSGVKDINTFIIAFDIAAKTNNIQKDDLKIIGMKIGDSQFNMINSKFTGLEIDEVKLTASVDQQLQDQMENPIPKIEASKIAGQAVESVKQTIKFIKDLFINPKAALKALSAIGSSMTEEERAAARKVVVPVILVNNVISMMGVPSPRRL